MNLLNEREKTHGKFRHVSDVSHRMKTALRRGNMYSHLAPVHREALDMICVKIARIVNGNFCDPDHWTDVIGYAQLVLNHITKDVPGSSTQQEPPDEENECCFCGHADEHEPWCILRRNEG